MREAGEIGQRLGPVAPGLIGLGGVAGAGAKDQGRAGRQFRAPAQAAPARGCAGIVHRRFVIAGAAGDFAQAVDAAHVAGGDQHGILGRQTGAWLRLRWSAVTRVMLAVAREAVDAPVGVGGEEQLVG